MANPAVADDFKIGSFAGGVGAIVTLASINIPNPHPVYRQGVQSVKLGSNAARLVGSPVLEWHWGFLTQTQRDVLRTYCTGASAHVYVRSVTTEKISGTPNAAVTYSAQMWWPAPNTPEDPQTGRRLEFVVVFRQLVAA